MTQPNQPNSVEEMVERTFKRIADEVYDKPLSLAEVDRLTRQIWAETITQAKAEERERILAELPKGRNWRNWFNRYLGDPRFHAYEHGLEDYRQQMLVILNDNQPLP